MSVIVLAASLIHFASIGRQRRLLLFSLKRVVPYRQIVCLYTHELEGFFGFSWFFIFLVWGRHVNVTLCIPRRPSFYLHATLQPVFLAGNFFSSNTGRELE